MISAFAIIPFLEVDFDIIISIYLLFLFLYAIALIYLRPRLQSSTMSYHYYRMILDNMPMLGSSILPFSHGFVKHLSNNGFTSTIDRNDYQIYYQFVNKLQGIPHTGKTLLMVVLAKNKAFDFYSEVIDQDIQLIKAQSKEASKIYNQIVLQFKQVNEWNDTVKQDIESIINYVDNNRALIHITCGVNANEQQIYYLRPKSKYPNKYYYFSCQMINSLCGIVEEKT